MRVFMEKLFKHNMPHVHRNFREDARIVLYAGDCLDAIADIPPKSIQLIITSPPYNIGKAYENTAKFDKYLEAMKPTLRELVRVLSPQGSFCWQVGNYVEKGEVFPLDIFYYSIFKGLGLHLRNRIIWYFNHGLHASKRFSGRYETILWFTKTDEYKFNLDAVRVPSKYPGKRYFKGPKKGLPSCNPIGKNPADIWEIVAQDWCVLALTSLDDWVLDPFAGVGSVLIGAIMHNRRAMACEKEPQYIETAKKRLQDYYAGTLRIRPLGKPIHKPSGSEKVCQIPKEWGKEDNREGLFK